MGSDCIYTDPMLQVSNKSLLRLTLLLALLTTTAVAAFAQAAPYKFQVEMTRGAGLVTTFQGRRVEYDVQAESSWTKGGGASVGKPNPGKFRIIKDWDDNSLGFLQDVATGKAIPKIVVTFSKPNKKGLDQPYYQITLEACFITSYRQVGADHDVATLDNKVYLGTVFETNELEEVQVVYKKITLKNLITGDAVSWDVASGVAG